VTSQLLGLVAVELYVALIAACCWVIGRRGDHRRLRARIAPYTHRDEKGSS